MDTTAAACAARSMPEWKSESGYCVFEGGILGHKLVDRDVTTICQIHMKTSTVPHDNADCLAAHCHHEAGRKPVPPFHRPYDRNEVVPGHTNRWLKLYLSLPHR